MRPALAALTKVTSLEDWLWFLIMLVSNGMLLWSSYTRYKHGVWDGAFHQFLPHVQRHMREYDPDRAEALLQENGHGKE